MKVGYRVAALPDQAKQGLAVDHDEADIEGAASQARFAHTLFDLGSFAEEIVDDFGNLFALTVASQSKRVVPATLGALDRGG